MQTNAAPGTEHQRDQWVTEYRAATLDDREIVTVDLGGFTYIFDSTPSTPADSAENRMVGVYGRSGESHGPRDKSRMSGHPNPRHVDRGHFVNRASGGGYDINLFPQESKLNQGHSEEGKVWREMERYMAENEDTEFFVRPTYQDDTDYPSRLEFGIRLADGSWRIESFDNRPQ
jgi:hypothetical protein